MLHELVRASDVDELPEADLRDDRAELAARGRDTVGGAPVTRRESLAGDDERRRVRPEVLEEIRQANQEEKCMLSRGR